MAHSTLETICKFRLKPVNKLARDGMLTKKRGVTKKKNKNKKKIQPIAALRLAYLHMVIDAELRNSPIPNIPKNSCGALSESVKEVGGTQEWAKKQPAYRALKIKKQKRFDKKQSKKIAASSITAQSAKQAPKEKAILALEKRIEENECIINIALRQIENDKQFISDIKSGASNHA